MHNGRGKTKPVSDSDTARDSGDGEQAGRADVGGSPAIDDPTVWESAAEWERYLALEAKAIRKPGQHLSPELFEELAPLLRAPIHPDHLETLPPMPGKPYESTGIKSVQVQINRMDAVLGPTNWRDACTWEQNGRLALVSVQVLEGGPGGEPMVYRYSHGGVDHGSSLGNIHKGSYTNAAKLAFARVGVGHEVYMGEADLDPDVNAEVAEQVAAAPPNPGAAMPLTAEQVEELAAGVLALGDRAGAWKAFLLSRGVGDTAELKQSDYEPAKKWLLSQHQAQAQAQAS